MPVASIEIQMAKWHSGSRPTGHRWKVWKVELSIVMKLFEINIVNSNLFMPIFVNLHLGYRNVFKAMGIIVIIVVSRGVR